MKTMWKRRSSALVLAGSIALVAVQATCISEANASGDADDAQCASLVKRWNGAHTLATVDGLQSLFASKLKFYGTDMTAERALAAKVAFLRRKPTFQQRVAMKEAWQDFKTKELQCNFTKTVTVRGKTTVYPSYLTIRHQQKQWQIIAESDHITDTNLANAARKKGAPALGDLDGDGQIDRAWVKQPVVVNGGSCHGKCRVEVHFLGSKLPPLPFGGIEAAVEWIADLDGNGTPELGITPTGFGSCWSGYHVYAWQRGRWKELIPTVSQYCEGLEEGVPVVMRHPTRAGYVIVHSVEMSEDGPTPKTSVVKIR